ncbi:protein of unknown function [Candidatus Filomicrobium marinum]|uniref:Uncharacterized protein n=1 Tax=Candidatus Filomicrobium marinum TaxID=1608628 RepID=A0A0D6JB01_9HYPH|nr:protein of unknown function [Candidatus Filomicrobium marinum]CPR16006.1 protein of unknown function [Candidatus Filomicrobium marinum]
MPQLFMVKYLSAKSLSAVTILQQNKFCTIFSGAVW